MYGNMEKIVKKDTKPTEIEEDVAKALFDFELSRTFDDKEYVKKILIMKAEMVQSDPKYLLIRVPYKSLDPLRKVQKDLIDTLEKKFSAPIIMVGWRTIMSKVVKTKGKQRRPFSKTLSAVNQALMDDVVYPNIITGKRVRFTKEGSEIYKIIFSDRLKDQLKDRLAVMTSAYKKLTQKNLQFEFQKTQEISKKIKK